MTCVLRKTLWDASDLQISSASTALADIDALIDQRYINDGINPLAGMEYYTYADDEARTKFVKSQQVLLHMRFILAHANSPNANGDVISTDLMKKIYHTAIFKPIDVEHQKPTIGTIIAARFVQPPHQNAYTECEAVEWRMFYPDEAERILKGWKNHRIRMSMELYFKECTYRWGDKTFTEQEAVRRGLDKKRGQRINGHVVERWFSPDSAMFGGAAIVVDPADRDAIILAAAADMQRWQRYHDTLLKIWARQDWSLMSRAELRKEHRWLHEQGLVPPD